MPSDWMPDNDPRIQPPGSDAGRDSETGRSGDDVRGVGEDADDLLEDSDDFSELDDEEEDEGAF